MYPKANIPCVQISLSKSLDPAQHIKIGQALRSLRQDNILIIGSGFSFHKLKVFMSKQVGEIDEQNEAFEQWLINTCSSDDVSAEDREKQLIEWGRAPTATACLCGISWHKSQCVSLVRNAPYCINGSGVL